MPRFMRTLPRAVQPTDPGDFRDQIRIQYKVVTGQGPDGADLVVWTTKYSVFSQVRALAGSEAAKLQQRWANAEYEIECQYLDDVTEDMRISWWDGKRQRNLNILSSVDPEGRNAKLWMICEEIKGANIWA